MWAPCSAPRRSLAHPREGVLVGHVPVGSLVPHQAPKNVPTPATRKASQGQPTSLTAWASLLAWGQGVRAAFLEGETDRHSWAAECSTRGASQGVLTDRGLQAAMAMPSAPLHLPGPALREIR